MMDIRRIIEHGAEKLEVKISPGAAAAFSEYLSILEVSNESINLTAIKGSENIIRLHFLDSLALMKAVEFSNAKVIDVGSGAGFPGLPLKFAEPSIDLTLLDATRKKTAFLSDLCTSLRTDVEIVNARAEDAAHIDKMRERFDIAVSRAVAHLDILCELCLPFVRVGGAFFAMKSADFEGELDGASGAMRILGAELAQVIKYEIAETGVFRNIICINKIASTPTEYPRRFSKIKNQPLI